ncbi:MAG: redoxin domain-containing protein [Planctomycetaceae bacterium]|nr:redoxin domain-containing protein [Planctomycetaceae bacterium]
MRNSIRHRWISLVLAGAGICNLVAGSAAILFPLSVLHWLAVHSPLADVMLGRSIGTVIALLGVGYLAAAISPLRYWPVVLIGLLGKLAGPVVFAAAVWNDYLPLTPGWMVLLQGSIWTIPFGAALWTIIRIRSHMGTSYLLPEDDDPLRELRTSAGLLLDELTTERPFLVVFLRHAGCTFCREALADIAAQRTAIEATGCGIVLVHPGVDDRAEPLFHRYGLSDLPRISDPACRLYRQFGLNLGRLTELLAPRVWWRGLVAGVIHRHGVGAFCGNGLQMPGVFLYQQGRILAGFQHEVASDRPDYLQMVRDALRVNTREPAVVCAVGH